MTIQHPGPSQSAAGQAALDRLAALAADGGALAAMPQASHRTWLALDPALETETLLRQHDFAKNNMRRWREAEADLAPSGARILGLKSMDSGPASAPDAAAWQDWLGPAVEAEVATLAGSRRQEFDADPLRAVQCMLTRLLPPLLFGAPLAAEPQDVVEATDLLECSHGVAQLHAFFGVTADVPDEDAELEARLMLHHAFRSSYFAGQSGRNADSLDAFIALYRAGVASPSAAAIWLCRALAAHPAAQRTMRAQLQHRETHEAGRAALRAFLLETMRLFPPAWLLVRIATHDTLLGSQTIAAGDHLLVSPYLRHRHPSLWKDADRFDAQRFAGAGSSQARQLLSFGHGVRKCPAMNFGMQLLGHLAEQLVLRFEIAADAPDNERSGAFDLWVNFRPAGKGGLRFGPPSPPKPPVPAAPRPEA